MAGSRMSEQVPGTRLGGATTPGAERPVVVTVLHGGFDQAGHALMVGVYADEEMSGAERFLDRQFDGLLGAWRDLGRYPGPLGTSVFVERGRDVGDDCEPAGAHLVGLGSTLTLSRGDVAFAARRALVDRCLRLYTCATQPEAGRTVLVGVSSALLGVRNDDGLRVEDAVTAVLEAVWHTNRDLARFEAERKLDAVGARVRIGFVQFVERYADRANLAAVAVRNAGNLARLPWGFAALDDVCVTTLDDGALPAGAAALESDRSWRRFVITEQKSRPPATAPAAAPVFAPVAAPCLPGSSFVVDVSVLERDARADRLTHRIDRASLDALAARVAEDRSNVAALRALRDLLVPNSMRAQFLTTSAIQLIVDAATANYPWELLAASALDTLDVRAADGTGAVLRMFAETETRRLQPQRATVGRALVIGAHAVCEQAGFPLLPGVLAEVAEVGALLEKNGIATERLVDAHGPLDVADLNIALYGDHQILHIAGHGVYVEDDPEQTGAVLTDGMKFTVDVVNAMPIVPELVFLNCCDNGRIGLNRLAAGLARELMAIGVRAVVAAAWPVNDRAARTFAHTFYDQLTSGRTFGDAVTQARAACASIGNGATWAAYQCYGDPTFVLRGRSSAIASTPTPVSLSDLEVRLRTLLTQIADFSRPKYGSLPGRREQLLGVHAGLAAWAEGHRYDGKPAVVRLLARASRELGDFDRAAERYAAFADPMLRDASPLAGRDASAFDLQQAANCLARGAQEAARAALQAGDDAVLADALARFPRAVALARGAIQVLDDDEGHCILASVYKKWASVDLPGRTAHLEQAKRAYSQVKERRRGEYGVENRIQLTTIFDPDGVGALLAEMVDTEATGPGPASDDTATMILVDVAPPRGEDFWARAARGDRALTAFMVATAEDERRARAAEMTAHYSDAFSRRSTFSERSSSIDHLRDLYDLLPEHDHRRPPLQDALAAFAAWNRFASSEGEQPPTTAPLPTRGADLRAVGAARAEGRGDVRAPAAAAVTVTAVPAACGDCLLLEYSGDDGRRRILIDGGLGTAFNTGLGRVLGPKESPTKVDVAVVTHVDLDHIEGTIRALTDGRLDADDFWFNGRTQLEQHFSNTVTRGYRQGDALSKLVPDARRNAVAHGGPLVVPAVGLPVYELPGRATATLLSPSEDKLRALWQRWPEPTRGVGSLEHLADGLADDLERKPGQFGKDGSVANGSSIAFLFEHDGISILFTADAHADVLEASIRTLLAQRGASKLAVQLFKLPHHGSRQNITDSLLDLVEPEHVLVCTDGSRFRHPDQDAIAKVRLHYPTAKIHFTDPTDLIKERAEQVQGEPPRSLPTVITLTPA